MKKLILLLFFISFTSQFIAQPREVTDVDIERINQKIENEISLLKQEDQKKHMFTIDTLKIERMLTEKLEIDYSTFGMVKALYEAENKYDTLINKYYTILINLLDNNDKKEVKHSQLNWIKFRDSERRINDLLAKDNYSGGGTIQRILIADKFLKITKQRVIELEEYLQRLEYLQSLIDEN